LAFWPLKTAIGPLGPRAGGNQASAEREASRFFLKVILKKALKWTSLNTYSFYIYVLKKRARARFSFPNPQFLYPYSLLSSILIP